MGGDEAPRRGAAEISKERRAGDPRDADVLEAERGVPAAAIEGLRQRGHRVEIPYEPHGGGQAIWIDWYNGTLTGASDPRKDGCALGY